MSKRDKYQDAWLGLGDTSKLDITSKFVDREEYFVERPDLHLYTIMRPDIAKQVYGNMYFQFTCKHLLNINLMPDQALILETMWNKAFPMLIASRGFSKSFLSAVYAILRCVFVPNTKAIIVGSAFRQSKIVMEYVENIWNNAPRLRSLFPGCDGIRREADRWTLKLGDNWITAVPLGNGDKIRGLRASLIFAEEFASIPPDIYETVVQGFAIVSTDPVEKVKQRAKRQALIDDGLWTDDMQNVFESTVSNQSIISGTPDYSFQHFAKYWRKYSAIIKSNGDIQKFKELIGDEIGEIDSSENLNPKDYAVIRIPCELVPTGFMDEKLIARARLNTNSSIFKREYNAVFETDSDGFFKRSLIESTVANEKNNIIIKDKPIIFDPKIKGDPKLRYVYGIDPAASQDNFAIVILEMHPDHSRIVYCWTTNKKDFSSRQKAGVVNEHDYYKFCSRKIRDLMKVFPVQVVHGPAIAIDSQGGGFAISEALHDPTILQPGEALLWPTIDPNKKKDTDDKHGQHILEMVSFASADWTSTNNHGLRHDLEKASSGMFGALLFPRFDPITVALALEEDQAAFQKGDKSRLYDSLDDCVYEIEQLKDELSTIVMSMTGTGVGGRERWDTPETKGLDGKKGRMRKDRYSALLMANSLARNILLKPSENTYEVIGGLLSEINIKQKGDMYSSAPQWWTEGGVNDGFYQAITRNN